MNILDQSQNLSSHPCQSFLVALSAPKDSKVNISKNEESKEDYKKFKPLLKQLSCID